MVFDLYQESDAKEMAELFNRNRFHSARNKHITEEDFLFIHRCRAPHFTVVAKKSGKIIGTAGVYPASDQSVANKNQVFIGNFLVDMRYRLSYSIIVGLFKTLMEGIAKTDFKEIITNVRPENESSYHLMLKCGFVILDNTPNDFGRIKLNCFSPALGRYTGVDGGEVDTEIFFSTLPVVDKKEARRVQSKPRLHERYIQCDYLFEKQQVTLLFDVVNFKIDGAIAQNHLKIYPDFTTQGRYIVENLQKKKPMELSIELVMEKDSGLENIHYDITLEPGDTKDIDCSKEVRTLKFKYSDQWFNLYPNLFVDVEPVKEPMKLSQGEQSIVTDPATGFITVMNGKEKTVTFMWPCGTYPYLEGVAAPRVKDLAVKEVEDGLVITEETDEYRLVRRCILSKDKMNLTTTLTCKTKELNVRPISQIYANKGVIGYSVKSGEEERKFPPAKIKHQGYEFSDYTYWDTEPEKYANFPVEKLSLKYPNARVDITLDERSRWIDHAPIFTSTLDFDFENILEEQTIEELEIHYKRTEER